MTNARAVTATPVGARAVDAAVYGLRESGGGGGLPPPALLAGYQIHIGARFESYSEGWDFPAFVNQSPTYSGTLPSIVKAYGHCYYWSNIDGYPASNHDPRPEFRPGRGALNDSFYAVLAVVKPPASGPTNNLVVYGPGQYGAGYPGSRFWIKYLTGELAWHESALGETLLGPAVTFDAWNVVGGIIHADRTIEGYVGGVGWGTLKGPVAAFTTGRDYLHVLSLPYYYAMMGYVRELIVWTGITATRTDIEAAHAYLQTIYGDI